MNRKSVYCGRTNRRVAWCSFNSLESRRHCGTVPRTQPDAVGVSRGQTAPKTHTHTELTRTTCPGKVVCVFLAHCLHTPPNFPFPSLSKCMWQAGRDIQTRHLHNKALMPLAGQTVSQTEEREREKETDCCRVKCVCVCVCVLVLHDWQVCCVCQRPTEIQIHGEAAELLQETVRETDGKRDGKRTKDREEWTKNMCEVTRCESEWKGEVTSTFCYFFPLHRLLISPCYACWSLFFNTLSIVKG